MKDNELLVEFESLVDLDLAMYKFIREKYSNSEYVDNDFIHEKDEREVIYKLLHRTHINPLEIILPNIDSTGIYYDILNNHYEELLSFATVYDTFGLMITFLNNASSVGITVLCKSELESNYIKRANSMLNTIIIPDRASVSLSKYTVLYVKYLSYLYEYDKNELEGKHIYFQAAKYNMEEDQDAVSLLCYPFSDVNILHMMDYYVNIKYRFERKD